MTALPKLTTLEKDVLAGVYASQYADGRCPNVWSWSIEPLICEMQQRKGVVSSLNKKGIVTSEGTGDEASMWVSEIGAQIAEAEGFYNDEDGYRKEAHENLAEVHASDKKIEIKMESNPGTGLLTPVASKFQAAGDAIAKAVSKKVLKADLDACRNVPAGADETVDAIRAQAATQSKKDKGYKITVRVAPGLAQVLSLDDPAMQAEMGLVIRFAKTFLEIYGTRKALEGLLRDCQNRCSGDFDQPLWYTNSAAQAAKKIAAALGGK